MPRVIRMAALAAAGARAGPKPAGNCYDVRVRAATRSRIETPESLTMETKWSPDWTEYRNPIASSDGLTERHCPSAMPQFHSPKGVISAT